MDSRTFDGMIKKLSASLSRRSLIGGSLGAAVLAAVGLDQDASGERMKGRRDVGAEEACITTGRKCPSQKPRGKKGKKLGCDECCQGHAQSSTNSKGKKVTKCSCKPERTGCTDSSQCCTGTCAGGVCTSGGTASPPPPICPALGQTCTTSNGTACCPSIDPNVVCAGGLNAANKVCQDCNQAPTAAGAYCQDPQLGNQCCSGKPGCGVGVRVEDNQPACFRPGTCRSTQGLAPCTHDFAAGGCPGGQLCCISEAQPVCFKGSATCGCTDSFGTPLTFCGGPCT